jgi:hypothetical protein
VIVIVAAQRILESLKQGVAVSSEMLKSLALPRRCPSCPNGSLMAHGVYWRVAKVDDREFEIPIQRLRCRCCGKAFSCLYDFLVPHRKAIKQAICQRLEEMLRRTENRTLSGRDPSVSRGSEFRLMRMLLATTKTAYMRLWELAIDQGLPVLSAPNAPTVALPDRRHQQMAIAMSFLCLAQVVLNKTENVLQEALSLSGVVLSNNRLSSPHKAGNVHPAKNLEYFAHTTAAAEDCVQQQSDSGNDKTKKVQKAPKVPRNEKMTGAFSACHFLRIRVHPAAI